MNTPLLKAENLTKSFGGFVAVSDVSLTVEQGSIHALIGPNGAGKTTLFNLLTKVFAPDNGRILFKGQDITRLDAAAVARLGIVRSFQISAIFPHLSVGQNIEIALLRATGDAFRFWKPGSSLRHLAGRIEEFAARFKLADKIDTTAIALSYGQRRSLEIATTVATEPELVLLDEPMAGLSHADIPSVSQIIRSIGQTRTVVMIEHNLGVVADLSTRISVLSRGRILVEGSYAEVAAHPDVRSAYLGSRHA